MRCGVGGRRGRSGGRFGRRRIVRLLNCILGGRSWRRFVCSFWVIEAERKYSCRVGNVGVFFFFQTIGSLASIPPTPGHRLNGVLVCRDFTYRLMAPEDLPEFTDLVPATIEQRLVVPARAPFGLVKWLLEMMYGRVEVTGKRSCRVCDIVFKELMGDIPIDH